MHKCRLGLETFLNISVSDFNILWTSLGKHLWGTTVLLCDWATAPVHCSEQCAWLLEADNQTAWGKLQATSWALYGAALSFAIMLQWLRVKLWLIGFGCVANSRSVTCALSLISRDGNFRTRINRLVGISWEVYDILVFQWYLKSDD